MKEFTVRLIRNKNEYATVLRIRKIVFIKGQNVPAAIERDRHETSSKHFIAFYRNKPVGCARLRFVDDKIKLERVAVLESCRGKGFGAAIMQHLIRYAKKKKPEEIYVNAQCHVGDFYKKLGFKPVGKIFSEAGIEHIRMRMKN